MRGVWSPGICHWFRTRRAARAVAWACLAVLLANLVAPLAWAVALPPAATPASVPPVHVHQPAPDATAQHQHHHHDAGASAAAVPVSDPSPSPATGHSHGLTPHCPMCVLFGGTAWAPPVGPSLLPAFRPVVIAAGTITASPLSLPQPAQLRPSPRAPPVLI